MSSAEHEAVVRRSFERQVQLFSGPDAPFARRATGPLTWIEPLEPGMIVLDVACGAGHAAEQVAPSVRHVVGIDLTTALLKLGADRVRDNGIGNVLLLEGNAERMPFLDESFDLAFCRSSLHHFADPHQAVSEMVRVCRHDGRVVLLDIVPPDPAVRDHFDYLHRLLDPSHVRSFLECELADLLPGGLDGLTYADTFSFRLPVDVAITDQSDSQEVLRLLRDELQGAAPRSGLEPTDEDGKVMVDFTTCVVHTRRSDRAT
ncbi:MAG: methyltransferase domain-containing protein [Actinobacteria bacterium]|nr:MAG: methyltransferase domain-containing protein [Actinomycetota bacterium]